LRGASAFARGAGARRVLVLRAEARFVPVVAVRRADLAAVFRRGAGLLVARLLAARAVRFFAAVFAVCRAVFRAVLGAEVFLATFRVARFAAVLRRAAGRLAFAAFRAVLRPRVLGLIVVSDFDGACSRAGALSVAKRGFTQAKRARRSRESGARCGVRADRRRGAHRALMAFRRSSARPSPENAHMKNEPHPSADLTRLGELIEGIEVAMLTTHAGDGSMVSRPLQTLRFDASGDLVFFTAADSRKLADLAANPDVNLAYANPKKQVYVSVRGTARTDHDRATIDALWSPVQKVFFPEGKNDPNLVVLRVRVRDAAYWESAGNFIARALDFASGMLSHEPRDLGKHGTLAGNG
jgi:general stress protein 26